VTRKPDQLKRLAEDLLCPKCRERPRLASTQRCRECLRVDTQRELAARPDLLAGRAPKSNHQQAAASSSDARKARRAVAAPTSKAPAPPAAGRARPQPVRQPPELLTAKGWTARLSDWAKRCWRSNDPDVQERIAIRDIGGDIIEQTGLKVDYVYGGPHGAPHMRVFANGDPHLDVMRSVAERMWRLPVKGELVTANGVSSLRTACAHCGVMVRIPCNETRARNCQNRRTR
jgi:hypothetical protein